MQYNTWKRVFPSNPVSSHPAFCLLSLSLSLSLSRSFFLSLSLYPKPPCYLPGPLSFALKYPKSCARHDRAYRKVLLGALSQVRICVCDPISSDFHSFGTCTGCRAWWGCRSGWDSIFAKIAYFQDLHDHPVFHQGILQLRRYYKIDFIKF